jgi:tetratricopeptide (TPR) repeat protein
MALLVHKKCISFGRLVEQFNQAAIRPLLLSDAVFDQLKDQTFMAAVKKGWEQLLKYFNKRYPQLTSEQHEQHLKQFVEILQQEMIKEEKAVELLVNQQVDNDIVQNYWQAIEASCGDVNFNLEELICWLHCLLIFYDKAKQIWHVSQAGITALTFLINSNSLTKIQIFPVVKEVIEAKKIDSAKTLKIPTKIDLSIQSDDSTLKRMEIAILTIGKPSEFKVWQLPTVNPYFIPRPKLTAELKAKLPQKKTGEGSAKLLLTAATGMGGIGKTELARHFITKRELSNHYQRRFWLTATTASQLRNEFVQLAIYLGLVEAKKYIEDKELIHHVHRWLSINPGWLMVLDNADDYNSIASWIPKEGGAVLVTTREPTPGTMSPEQIIPVPLLEPEEAVTWLYELSKREKDKLSEQEQAAAKQLVDDLGYLPLAVAQAAAYLREQSNSTITGYHKHFTVLLSDATLASQTDSKSENTLNDPDKRSRRVVASTWMLSFQAIEDYATSHNMPNITKELLLTCAYFAPKNIPLLLLETCLKQSYQFESNQISFIVDEYIGQLIRYSLLERNNIDSLVSMHKLVQQIMQAQLIKDYKGIEYLLKGISSINKIYPYGTDKNQMFDYQFKKELVPHLEHLLNQIELISDTAYIQGIQDNEDKSRAFNILREKKIILIIRLADAYEVLAHTKQAIKILETALNILNNYFGQDQIALSAIFNNLANSYGELGNYVKKKELLTYALRVKENIYGLHHPELGTTLTNLGNAHGALGDLQNAKELLERALSIKQDEYGYNHVELAITLHALGIIYGDLGNVNQKKKLLKRSLKIQEKNYGLNHIFIAQDLTDLGFAYAVLHKGSKAQELLKRALIIKESWYGNNNVKVAITLVTLGNTYLVQGNTEEAKKLLERAYHIKVEYYGRDNIEVARTAVDLGTALAILKNVFQAKELLENALLIFEKYYNRDNVDTAKLLTNLANFVYGSLGNLEQQKILLERALGIYERNSRKYVDHGSVLLSLGTVNAKIFNLDTAIKQIELAYDIFLHHPDCGENHYLTNKAKIALQIVMNFSQSSFTTRTQTAQSSHYYLKLANTYYEQGNLEESIRCYSNVIMFSPENSSAHQSLACLYHVQGNSALAEQHFKHALSIKVSASAHCDYGFLLLRQKCYEEAAKNFITAIILGNDGSGLMYGKLEKKLLDEYLQQEITTKSNLEIIPFFIAHYWLIQCFELLNDTDLRDFYLIQLAKFIQKSPSVLHYRILEYAYRLLGDNTEKVDEIIAAALSQKNTKKRHEEQEVNLSKDKLNELAELIERKPTALRYRLLSYVYSAIHNEEKAQEYMALAMSLEPTLESQTVQQKATNERTTNYNPTLFGGNKVTSPILGNFTQQESSLLEIILREAKILPKMMQNKEIVEVNFFDHKLVQQFADELHKIGISNINMKDEPRKPNIIIGSEGKEDEYIILLSPDEYNIIMRDKDAYAKLASNQHTQSQLSFKHN